MICFWYLVRFLRGNILRRLLNHKTRCQLASNKKGSVDSAQFLRYWELVQRPIMITRHGITIQDSAHRLVEFCDGTRDAERTRRSESTSAERAKPQFFAPKLLLRNGREPSPVAPFPFFFSFHSCNVRYLSFDVYKRTRAFSTVRNQGVACI